MKNTHTAGTGDADHSAESRRILDRVAREGDAGGFALLGRTAARTRDHLGATDADQSDWAELWGTRIGRLIGALALVALAAWALRILASGA
jgi:hypothetical protein